MFSASKKDKATGILDLGFNVLKKLYGSDNLDIRVRALVVSCSMMVNKQNQRIQLVACKI